jgi:hypothetical protein
MTLHGKLGKSKYGWEISMFNKFREFKDGISFVEFDINFDKFEADHCPRFEVCFVCMNFIIVHFEIYNRYHVDHEDYR